MIVKEQKAFPANMLEVGSYDGMKTFVVFIFMLALWYFISGIFKIQNWDNSWLLPDALLKTATFMSRLFILTLAYCVAWLTFDKRSLEGYVFSIISFALGIVYIISPLDFIPDMVPGIGMIDDVFVGGGSIWAAIISFNKSKIKKENSKRVIDLLNAGKETEALKVLLYERGINVVENN